MKNIKGIRKILVINLGGIGDFFLSTPALRALKKAYPESSIAFMGVPRVCEIANNSPYFDRVIPFTFYDEKKRKFLFSRFFQLFKFLRALRREKFDLTINMRTIVSFLSALRMAYCFWIIGSPYRLGRDTEGRGFFLNMKIPESDAGDKLEMDYDLQTVGLLGADVSDKSFDSGLFGQDLRRVSVFLENEGIKDSDRIITVNPGGMLSHRWPIENFIKVIEELLKRVSCKIVIIGGTQELGLSTRLKLRLGSNTTDLIGRLSIFDSAALLKRSQLLITNDTGPMHMAAILKTPMVAIFGGGYLTRFDPRKISSGVIVLSKNVACAPCDKAQCATLKCLKEILPEDVLGAALRLLGE
jgi:heptosyltransferase-2